DKPDPEDVKGPTDRTAAIQQSLQDFVAGNYAAAFKYLEDDVTWTEVGLPDGELTSKEALIKFQERQRAGFSDLQMKAARIIEAADYQVVEFVWTAKHTGTFADGTQATNKTVTMPGAMLVHYDTDDGMVDKVWVFQDWP